MQGKIVKRKATLSEVLNYIVMFIIVGFGGITFFTGNRIVFIICYLLIGIVFLYKQNVKFYSFKNSLLFIISILLLFSFQGFIFNDFNLINLTGLLMTLTFGLIAILVIGPDFLKYYIKIIYIFSLISFVFVFLSIFLPSLYQFLSTLPAILGTDPLPGVNDCLIVYNFERFRTLGIIRNSGPFYEAGAFACYLNLALILNSIKAKFVSKENIVFIIAILTTFSTAGYIILLFFLSLRIIISSEIKFFIKIAGVATVFIISWQIYTQLPFLKEKIETQYIEQTDINESSEHTGRFGSAISDLTDLKGYYISGRGLVKSSRFEDEDTIGSTNGVTDLLSRFGIIGFGLYFFLILKSMKIIYNYYNKKMESSYWFVILLLLIGFSQVILVKPIFFMLLYFQGYQKWILYLKKSDLYSEPLL